MPTTYAQRVHSESVEAARRRPHPNTSVNGALRAEVQRARRALSCARGHAPGQVLHALQELRQIIDERLRDELGGRYDRHSAESVGTDKLTVTFILRAATHAPEMRR